MLGKTCKIWALKFKYQTLNVLSLNLLQEAGKKPSGVS